MNLDWFAGWPSISVLPTPMIDVRPNGERRGGKEERKRIHFTGFDQKMPTKDETKVE